MSEIDDVEYYRSLKPTRFGELRELILEQAMADGRVVINLTIKLGLMLSFQGELEHPTLVLRFGDVSGLQFEPQEGPVITFGFIEVTQISHFGWEHANYRVCETEQDNLLRFYCDTFCAELTE